MDRTPWDRVTSPARSAGGDHDEGTPSPEDLPACLSCRRRKSRCSRERPSCAQCLKIGAECQYVVKQKPGLKPGAVDGLNRRLEVLERLLLDCAGNAKAAIVALVDGDIERLSRDGLPPQAHSQGQEEPPSRPVFSPRPRQGSLPRFDAPGHVPSAQTPTRGAHPDEHRRKRQRVSDAESRPCWSSDGFDEHDEHDSWMPPLPPLPILEAIVEAHFQTVHHWIPILHETRFRAKLRDSAQRQQITVLLHALLSAAAKYVDFSEFGISMSSVVRQIRISQRAVMMRAMESLSIENTQALIIVAFDYMGNGQVTKAWPIIGSLTRIVDYLQLTTEPDQNSPKQPLLQSLTLLSEAQDWTESEERRRLFWNVFLLDRICSVTSGWHTSLTSDDVRRRLPCGGAMWARSEPVTTPFFGIWDKSSAKIGNSISNAPNIYLSPKTVDHQSPGSSTDVDTSKLGAFAYCIEATENLSQVTSFFLQQGVDFGDRDEVKNWLTRFKELDLRLVHWKMFLPRQWQDSNISRNVQVIKMDPNLTLAHISHNTSMILLHQHIAFPPARWKDVVKLPSSCSAETCHLAAVETACIVQKYLRYMGGIVNSQFAFCAFVAARVLLVHWSSSEAHTLAPDFFHLLQSLRSMSEKWRGYRGTEDGDSSHHGSMMHQTYKDRKSADLPSRYVVQLEEWHSRCANDMALPHNRLAAILCDASFCGFFESPARGSPAVSSSHGYDARSTGTGDRQYSSGFETYQSAGVSSPVQQTSHAAHGLSSVAALATPYDASHPRRQPLEISPRSQPGTMQSPAPTGCSRAGGNVMSVSGASAALLNGMGTANSFPTGQSMSEDDELTAMSHVLLGNQFLEMDRVITLQGTDFFSFEPGRTGFSG